MIRPVLVAPFGHHVEESIDAEKLLAPAGKGRIGVEDLANLVPIEDAVAGKVLQRHRPWLDRLVVVAGGACSNAFSCERHAKIIVEIGIERGDPGKPPAHPPAHDLNLLDRRTRDHSIAHVVILQMNQDALDVVDGERATHALMLVAWAHHEVLDHKLAATVEKVGEAGLSPWTIEDVVLFHA